MYERSYEQRADPDQPRERTDTGLCWSPGGDQTGGRPTHPYQACDARWDRRPSFQEKEITGSMNEEEQREAILKKHLAKQKEREANPKVERPIMDSGLMEVQTTIAPDPPSSNGAAQKAGRVKHRAMYVLEGSPENLDAIFHNRFFFPADYNVVHMGWDHYGMFMTVVVEHPSLPTQADGVLPYQLQTEGAFYPEGKYIKFVEYKENTND